MCEQDWDVDSYKTDYESEEHWELRKNFMLANKDKLPEDEVVCMAQVFTNIEFMGCRYPDQTMIRVAELAKGVVEKFREKRKNSLKRTFVAASDAASAKVKGLKRPVEATAQDSVSKYRKGISFIPSCNINEQNASKDSKCSSVVTIDDSGEQQSRDPKPGSFVNPFSSPAKSHSAFDTMKTVYINPFGQYAKPASLIKKPIGPLGEFILFLNAHEEHPVSIIERNASINKHSIRWDNSLENNQKFSKLFLNGQLVASGSADNLKSAKEAAALAGIRRLQECCYTVKVKAKFVSDRTVDSSLLGTSTTNLPSKSGKELGEDNVGRKLMKLMGWAGGGLGSQQQGIEEPIGVALQVRREGLGQPGKNSDVRLFKNKARDYVRSWMESNCDQDLVFSSEFSNEERKAMHEVASCFSLRSKSYGKGESRHLVISKKPSPWKIVEELAEIGGVSDKYELIYPTSELS